MSVNALSTPTETEAAWSNPGYQARRVYIRYADDRCIPHFAQDGMMAMTGVEWDVYSFDTSRSPFLFSLRNLQRQLLVWRGSGLE